MKIPKAYNRYFAVVDVNTGDIAYGCRTFNQAMGLVLSAESNSEKDWQAVRTTAPIPSNVSQLYTSGTPLKLKDFQIFDSHDNHPKKKHSPQLR